jgi:tRNA threonylcarbamoyladenosine biosynthesis protein TsaB
MRTLVIDGATEACSVALFDEAQLIAGEWRMLNRGHAEQLVPMIAALPDKGRADRIAVALGPGSFTGLRVGLAAARALALAWGAQLAGYPTLELVAAMARNPDVVVAMTGGHGEWFVQGFGTHARPLTSMKPQDAAALTADCVAGSQAEALVTLRGTGMATPLWPDARDFALLPASALHRDVSPLYGRAPDAKLPGAKLPETGSANAAAS